MNRLLEHARKYKIEQFLITQFSWALFHFLFRQEHSTVYVVKFDLSSQFCSSPKLCDIKLKLKVMEPDPVEQYLLEETVAVPFSEKDIQQFSKW